MIMLVFENRFSKNCVVLSQSFFEQCLSMRHKNFLNNLTAILEDKLKLVIRVLTLFRDEVFGGCSWMVLREKAFPPSPPPPSS